MTKNKNEPPYKHLKVKQLVEMLLKLDQEKEIRYEYDSSSCSLHWLEIHDMDEYYLMDL